LPCTGLATRVYEHDCPTRRKRKLDVGCDGDEYLLPDWLEVDRRVLDNQQLTFWVTPLEPNLE
jgi:hypothetical protein